MHRKFLQTCFITLICTFITTGIFASKAGNLELNSELVAAMRAYRVPVVGYAIIQNYTIVALKTISIDPGKRHSHLITAISNNGTFAGIKDSNFSKGF